MATLPHSAGAALLCVQKKPSGHEMHSVCAVAFWYVPASQNSHATDEAFRCTEPTPQASLSCLPGQR